MNNTSAAQEEMLFSGVDELDWPEPDLHTINKQTCASLVAAIEMQAAQELCAHIFLWLYTNPHAHAITAQPYEESENAVYVSCFGSQHG